MRRACEEVRRGPEALGIERMLAPMAELRDVELRIALAEGVVTRDEAEALADEARKKKQSPLALLVERGRLSEDSFQSMLAEALNDPAVRGTSPPGSASTYTMQGGQEPRPAEPAFPVAAWDRYINVRFLGQGGMGMVFLVIDARLRREVAIKFVRGDDADHVRRLISEARTQARVNHDRICKVYEVGEVEGRVYIAMQYIDGKPLGRLADELTLEQKVMLVRGAAEGIHEAHSAGIIHRDIKPSNIMVERSDDGEIRPYVMDFGLARSAQEAGTTQTGAVLGTPRYMAPEQAHGEATKLDRRADVYSLGATLYHLLTGAPPFPGEAVAEVLHNLMTTEPRPPRALDRNIPVDLEAIVIKCLEKDRTARYDSARALADDLGRFMTGEPVLARPAGAWYRLRKRLVKHRRLVVVGAAALVLLGVAVGWAIQTRLEASKREELARRFTEKVERIEARARYSALAPRHDIRGDRTEIRQQMDELRGEIEGAGELAAGPGHYALGRGYLALDDDAKAKTELEAAWNDGFREPRVAYALALAHGHLYQQGLLAVARTDDRQTREAEKRRVERQYRDPALAYLKQSQGAAEAPSPRYFDALMAYYEGRLDDALARLDATGGGSSWYYEVPELRGDILLASVLVDRSEGKTERARGHLEAGRKAYASAALVGESVPTVFLSLANLEYVAMRIDIYGRGDATLRYDSALAATAQVLAIQPDHYDALVLQAGIRRSMAEFQANQGQDAEALFAAALADAQHALALAPERTPAKEEKIAIYEHWGITRVDRDQDPREQLHQATEAAKEIPLRDRDAPYHHKLGLIYSTWADYQARTGANADDNRDNAIDAYTRAVQINDRLNEAWINLGVDLSKRAFAPHARDPDRDVAEAIKALEKARTINPDHYVPYFYQGRIYHQLAQRARIRGLDPEPDLQRAIDAFRKALAINDKVLHLYNGLGVVLFDQARAAWDRGGDPEPALKQAEAAFRGAISVAPEHPYGHGNLGEVFALRAWLQRARGEDPSANVGAAATELDEAIRRSSSEAVFWADLAMAYAVLAAYELDQGRDPQRSCDQASRAIGKALDIDRGDVQSLRYLGETRAIRARFQARRGKATAEDFTAAEQSFQKALDLDPDNPDTRLAFGQFFRAWAAVQRDTGQAPGPSLTRGLALANDVLSRHPAWPDALVLRASLTLLQAQSSASAADRRSLAERAAQDFTRALALHPALGKTWEGQAAQAAALR